MTIFSYPNQTLPYISGQCKHADKQASLPHFHQVAGGMCAFHLLITTALLLFYLFVYYYCSATRNVLASRRQLSRAGRRVPCRAVVDRIYVRGCMGSAALSVAYVETIGRAYTAVYVRGGTRGAKLKAGRAAGRGDLNCSSPHRAQQEDASRLL